MTRKRSRQLAAALVPTVALLALGACGGQYPNSTFNHTTDFNTDVDALWDRLLFLGTIVFIFVEGLLIYTMYRFRRREGVPAPKQVHGNAALEVAWTAIPALILVLIAVPTVRTIFKTQAKAAPGSLEIQVIGHQWWWEFRYPQYDIVTANEVYLPAGRTASFTLQSRDVLHSFWTPELGGKRDVVTNRTNYLWYTPKDSLTENAWNGFCAEYCGMSHANMRFRVYTVSADRFASWAAHQKSNAALSPAAASAAAPGGAPAVAQAGVAGAARRQAPPPPQAMNGGYEFPAEKLPPHVVPKTPLPSGESEIKFDDALLAQGDAARGRALIMNLANLGRAPCLTCHVVRGEQALIKDNDAKGPNLTHFASRHTFAGGIYPTDPRHLARWIKNAPRMKPGLRAPSGMPTLGIGEYSPDLKKLTTVGLTDREIADVVAYLMALK